MKQLHDLGLFQRIPLYLGSKLQMAKINMSYQFRYMIRAMEKRQLDFAFNEHNEKVTKTLYDFRKPYFFYNWVITNDKEIGGESEGNAYYNNDHVLVRGSLVEERNDLLQQRMYYGIVSQYFTKLNVVDYNGIRIRLKTDGNLYKVIMRVASIANNDHHIYGFIVDTSNEWQTIELPFQNFLSEGMSPLEKARSLQELGELTLKAIGIVIENEKGTDFEFAVEKIEVIYNPEFQALTQAYQRPFFFYSQESYNDVKVLDTGKEKLAIQIGKVQENKKSVNDLFTEEQPAQPYRSKDIPLDKEVKEAKPVNILKDRLAKKVNK